MLTVKSTINIASQAAPPIITAVQGDTGRSIEFTVADFTIPEGATATYYIQKPSGNAVYNTATISGNTVTVDLTAQSIAEYGDNFGQIRITKNGEIVTSFDFILLVKAFRGIDAIESTTEMNIFDQAVAAALEEIDGSLENIIAEEFDPANSYLAGEYVLKDGFLYKFLTNHSGSWSLSDVAETTVGEELMSGGGGGGGAVNSVNGKTGTVVLDAGDLEYDDEETYAAGSVGATLTSYKSDIDNIFDAIGTQVSSVAITPTRGYRYYYTNGEFKVVTDAGNTYYSDILDVRSGQKYYYSGRVYNYSNQYSVIVTDDNSNVLLYNLGNTTDTNVVDYPFTIPTGGTKLYITSYRKVSDAGSSDLALKEDVLFQIARITNEIGGVIPQYYLDDDWLLTRLQDINDNCNYLNGVVFPFITDIHFHSNAGNSKYLLKEVLKKTACSLAVAGGDYQGGFGGATELQREFDAWYDFYGYVGHDKLFPIAGNHDFYVAESSQTSSSDWIKADYGEVYNAIYRPAVRYITNRKDGGYYCVDIDSAKTRLVMMNSHEPSPVTASTKIDGLIRVRPEQVQWLISVLKEKTDYKMIVFSHATSDSSMPDYSSTMLNVQKVLEAFANKTSDTIQFTDQWSITADFTSTTNDLICHINGHSHVDASHVSNNVLSICTTCDACLQDDGYGAKRGTVTEQAFDVFCVDYDAEVINAVRVGRGENRQWSKSGGTWHEVTE